MAFLLITLFGLVVLVGIWFYLRAVRRSYQERLSLSERRFESLQNQLFKQMSQVDNLLNLLLDIHEFVTEASQAPSTRGLTQLIIDKACELMSSPNGSLMLVDEQTNELKIAAARGLPQDVIETTRLKLGEGIAGRVAQTGKTIFVEDIETDVRFRRASNVRYPSRSFISVPLRFRNKIIGVLNVSAPPDIKTFDERDVRILTIFADQAATILENAELYDNLQSFYLEMVETLARAIDAKDNYTYDHAGRARYYARRISTKLCLPEALIKHIEYAALLHDIGKIGINDAILRKPGKLTEEERQIIQQHPAIGNKILMPVKFLSPVAPIVLYHQEWYNGQGYPEGLAGEEIPLGARIVAVIDAFDAMTSDRPYRPALPKEVAISELKRGAGIQFDPKVVEAFLEVLREEENPAEVPATNR